MKMKFTSINHITINVTDLKRSVQFYRSVLGLEECGFIDMGDHTLTYFALPQNIRLELIHYSMEQKEQKHPETEPGTYRHFCLEADSISEFYEICRKNGAEIRKAPSYVEKLGVNTMLIVDPNGVEIEIIDHQGKFEGFV